MKLDLTRCFDYFATTKRSPSPQETALTNTVLTTLLNSLLNRIETSTVCLLMILVFCAGCETERAKWNLARATVLMEQGATEEAVELMHTALEQSPDDSPIKLDIARILAENGRGEMGVCLCEQHLKNFPNDLSAYEVRSNCFQYIGQFDKGLADYKKSLSDHIGRDNNELNALAYFRALADTELTKAARDIEEVIEYQARFWNHRLLLTLQVRTTVCAGLIARHTGQYEEVLLVLNDKIEQFDALNTLQQSIMRDRITSEIQIEFPLSADRELVFKRARNRQKQLSDCLGAMLATRALIYEDQEKFNNADADRRHLNQLGLEFDEIAPDLPSDPVCLETLGFGAMYLDTRGFVYGRQPWDSREQRFGPMEIVNSNATSSYVASIEDLNVAVLAAQVRLKAIEFPLYNSIQHPAQAIESIKQRSKRMTAVLLRHRMEVHQRAGKQDLADLDKQRIEALGEEPDSNNLF